jgi:minor histocompatibility antigen H13
MMVTVAKSLDVPIKLVFPRPGPIDDPTAKPSHAMLGLGDVVLPGIMIGLALRFDLFLFYLRRQKRSPATNDSEEGVEKPKYHSLAGRWSDHFWTHSLVGRQLFASNDNGVEQPFTFPKTYFNASLVGYVIGMLTTLGVMHVWGHAQPALLYLVPGVLGSLWLTAIARGELSVMWEFSEAAEEEDELSDAEKQDGDAKSKAAPERSSFFSLSDKKAQDREERMKKALGKHVHVDSESDEEAEKAVDGRSGKRNKVKEVAGHKSDKEVFSFSIEAPWKLKHPRTVRREDSKPEQAADELEQSPSNGSTSNQPSGAKQQSATEPPGKRARLR